MLRMQTQQDEQAGQQPDNLSKPIGRSRRSANIAG
jgi:hypothetical protein